MTQMRELIKRGNKEEIWQKCCEYIDLTMEEFMTIQNRLLLEQISLLKTSKIGQKIMGNVAPSSVEDFREIVPLTTYEDYCPELLEKQEDALPAKAVRWAHTSGKSGKYRFKWVPISEGAWEEMASLMYAASIFATCRKRGEILDLPSKFLFVTASAPYTTGVIAHELEEEFGYRFFPPLEDVENMPFIERLEKGISMALAEGIDGLYGITSMLVTIGERIKNNSGEVDLKTIVSNPKILLRVVKALIKSKLAGRAMVPKDLWHIKAMACGGTDSQIFRDKIKTLWGVQPLDIYGSTETLIAAMQTWDFDTMTFNPFMNFLEFIPESAYFKWKEDSSYEMKTILLDEVETGGIYELVVTNLNGGALMRYRTGDMIKIESLRNEKLNINTPQMSFNRRADDLIDIGTIFRFTETVVWKALENSGVNYVDWTARREIHKGSPVLKVYIEPKGEDTPTEIYIEETLYEHVKKIDDGFIRDKENLDSIEQLMGTLPIKVQLLAKGTFSYYAKIKEEQGADLAQLKPPHINPSEDVLSLLLTGAPTRTEEDVQIS